MKRLLCLICVFTLLFTQVVFANPLGEAGRMYARVITEGPLRTGIMYVLDGVQYIVDKQSVKKHFAGDKYSQEYAAALKKLLKVKKEHKEEIATSFVSGFLFEAGR